MSSTGTRDDIGMGGGMMIPPDDGRPGSGDGSRPLADYLRRSAENIAAMAAEFEVAGKYDLGSDRAIADVSFELARLLREDGAPKLLQIADFAESADQDQIATFSDYGLADDQLVLKVAISDHLNPVRRELMKLSQRLRGWGKWADALSKFLESFFKSIANNKWVKAAIDIVKELLEAAAIWAERLAPRHTRRS